MDYDIDSYVTNLEKLVEYKIGIYSQLEQKLGELRIQQ